MSEKMIRCLGVESHKQMYFWEYPEGETPEGHFRVETLYTGFSAGTELTFFKETNPFFHSTYDDEIGVFSHGHGMTHYPVPFLGYMEVARVTETRTPIVAEGDVVAMTYGHKSGHTVDPRHEFFVVLPPDLDPILGIYIGQMGPVCANGLLHAAADVVGANAASLADGVQGRNVLVMGAGVVGLLTGLFARHFGAANVAIADRTAQRLEAARALGLIPIDENTVESWRWCKDRWNYGAHDHGADVVFQCRADKSSLPNALRALRPDSTVIDLAFYEGGQPELRLGEEFHHNGLAIRCAQIYHQPRGLRGTWNRHRLALETLELMKAHGETIRKNIITDVMPFNEAPHLVSALSRRNRHVIQAVFQVAQ